MIYAPEETAEGAVLCPGCGGVAPVGPPAAPGGKPVESACPHCNASIRLIPSLVGAQVRCNSCRAILLVSLSLTKLEASALSVAGRVAPGAGRNPAKTESDAPIEVAPPSLPETDRPLPPREMAILRQIGRAANGRGAASTSRHESQARHAPASRAAPWFWPAVVAAAATFIMLIALVVIQFAT